jgi:dihydrofolate reductase
MRAVEGRLRATADALPWNPGGRGRRSCAATSRTRAARKDRPGGDIVTTGSITLVHALGRAGLVDEYRPFVHPVVSGQGRRLFEGPAERHELALVETHAFTSGIVLLRYRASGR